ncbi:MAG: transglutaminase-like domain-containing protein [Candidatus Cloacimonetes bacterium]|nr:transglutaminase-like domain-containing protein [Candidatus Cloacimonadota bacterium]
MKINNLIYIGISLIMISCSTVSYTEKSKLTLKNAKKNRRQLKVAAKYFHDKKQTDKLDALLFLYDNMQNHSFVNVGLFDENEIEVQWNFKEFKDYDVAKNALTALEDEFGELHWKQKSTKLDHQTVSSDFLIDNIDLAFKAWQEKPWSKEYNYVIFKEYILPYRCSNEPIESWRSWRGYYLDKFKDLPAKMFDPSDVLEASTLINDNLKTWFKFNPKYYLHPTDQGLFEMLINKEGRCEDMSNLAIYALRANGIAATSDYTPHWANTGNNHAWNVIILPNGKAVPFMGAEANPGKYVLTGKAAKVYRKVFSEQKDNLAFKIKKKEKVPAWLSGKCYTDVTTDYVNVSDVEINIETEVPDSTRFLYLAVFNSGEWQAIHWAELNDKQAIFTDMGVDIAYLPMFYVKGNLKPAADPFILTKVGNKKNLNGEDSKIDVVLRSIKKRQIDRSRDTEKNAFFEQGKEYELFYWDDGWISFGKQTSGDQPLTFKKLPAKKLYWLVRDDLKDEARIFTYENNKQIWW